MVSAMALSSSPLAVAVTLSVGASATGFTVTSMVWMVSATEVAPSWVVASTVSVKLSTLEPGVTVSPASSAGVSVQLPS